MKKFRRFGKMSLVLALIFILFFGISANIGVAYANSQATQVDGAESYTNAPGISLERNSTSGQMRTRVNTNNITLRFTGGVIGTFTSQAWWEMCDRLNIISFGPVQMRATTGPQHLPGVPARAELIAVNMPLPSVARVIMDGIFVSFAEAHTMRHTYWMYNTGRYAFEVNSW
jgi:hypothetical protein